MKLNELYKHRTDFTIIGLTGRTGSGCTRIAELLSNDFKNLKAEGLLTVEQIERIDDIIFKRKYQITYNYFDKTDNWTKFNLIKYRDVLIFLILNKCGDKLNLYSKLIDKYYSLQKLNHVKKANLLTDIKEFISKNEESLKKIKSIKNIKEARVKKLDIIHDCFFNKVVSNLATQFNTVLEKHGRFERTLFFHYLACDFRNYGTDILLKKPKADLKNIYYIAEIINRIVKSKRRHNNNNKIEKTKIVIDSLRNSLEIMFFKERFSGFYMLAVKDVLENRRERLFDRFSGKIPVEKIKDLCDKLLELDATEYKTTDFNSGTFSSPDVENCIQKSDYHIANIKKEDLSKEKISITAKIIFNLNDFITREEQLMKFIGSINHPGLITPNFIERSMQIAYTAKVNSGCTSRKVGAAIVDSNFSLKSIGWNDVSKGHTPCNLRSVSDYFNENLEDNPHYSEFEKGKQSEFSAYKYKKRFPHNFKDAIKDYFKDYEESKMEGLNCSFCFKTVHNHYEGESNQVHTRSLHAEENAMLQITKYGGAAAISGYLFTTASPCELCSKKAYQLGINTIFYIDPYPGISIDQILKSGQNQPRLISFTGAFGSAYSKLYEPYMSTKDEISLLLEIKSNNKLSIQLNNILNDIDDDEIKRFVKTFKDKPDDLKVIEMIKKGIK